MKSVFCIICNRDCLQQGSLFPLEKEKLVTINRELVVESWDNKLG